MSVMEVRIVISLEAVALSNKLISSEPADSATKSGGCLSNMMLTAPAIFDQMIKVTFLIQLQILTIIINNNNLSITVTAI